MIMMHTLIFYTLLISVQSQCERTQVFCSDIEYSGTVWGYAESKGILVSAYTNDELQFIGSESGTFDCTHPTSTSMEFVGSTMRSLLGPGSLASSSGGCCNNGNQRGICNAPDDATSATKLCRQLGYKQGTVTRVSTNLCAETHWDGSKWTSDWVGTAGYGGTFTCSDACTVAPTKFPSKTPSYSPSNNPTNIPTLFPSNNPTNIPTLFPSNNPSKSPSRFPTNTPTKVPTNNPSKSPTDIPTSVSNNPSKSPVKYPTNMPTLTPTHQLIFQHY
eukprot:180830_1